MEGQHTSITNPQPQVMSELAQRIQLITKEARTFRHDLHWVSLLNIFSFSCSAFHMLIRFSLACGDECIYWGELVDFLAFLPAEINRILFVSSGLFLDVTAFFFFPDFRGQTFPWFSSLNTPPPEIRGNKQGYILLLMCHSFRECLDWVQNCYRKKPVCFKSIQS